MRVVRMDELMEMIEARPRQAWRPEGIVTDCVFFEEGPVVTFVSYQWCSRNHSILS